MLEKIKQILISINEKKQLIVKTQKEVEIKIADLDKILDELQKSKTPKGRIDNGLNSKIKHEISKESSDR